MSDIDLIREVLLQLEREKVGQKKEHENFSQKFKKQLSRLGEIGLREGNMYYALSAYKALNDKANLAKVAERCLKEDQLHYAAEAFEFLNDREGLQRVMQAHSTEATEEGPHRSELDSVLQRYLGSETTKRFSRNFKAWASKQGFSNPVHFSLAASTNMAHRLAGNYDLGIGIAKGGLFSTYVFNLFELPTRIAEAHRCGRGATFNWVDQVAPEEITGKKIAVFDKDVISGRTTRRVLMEIKKNSPESVDLILNHDPVKGSLGLGTIASSIPRGYNRTYYPKSFDYKVFDQAVGVLEQKLRGE